MRLALDLPAGFHVAQVPIGRLDDRHECGRDAARRALAALDVDPSRLAYEGTRPVVTSARRRDRMSSEARSVVVPTAGVAALVSDGIRPPDDDAEVSVSITHGRHVALAIAARVSRLGIDLCDDDSRLPALAERFLVDEQAIARTLLDLTACFAAKEAALKALGLGLLDGGILDGTAVHVVSLAPPRLSRDGLHLALARVTGAAIAVVYG